MPICTEQVPLERLEFLNVTDDLFADTLRRCPVTQVKKTYARLETFPRLVIIPGGVCYPIHDYSETTNILSGYFEFPVNVISEPLVTWSEMISGMWCYVLLVTSGDSLNWLGAIKMRPIENRRIIVEPLYRRIESGVWVVSETPFEEV